MTPQEKKANRICGKTKKTKYPHDLEDRNTWDNKLVGYLGDDRESGEKDESALEQGNFGFDGSTSRNRIKTEAICQRIAKVIKTVC